MGLSKIKQEVNRLGLEQLRDLDVWLHEVIGKAEVAGHERISARENIRKPDVDTKTFRLEKVRCGKAGCKCAGGDLHGPYWYAYWSENGRTRSQYVGKNLPGKKDQNSLT